MKVLTKSEGEKWLLERKLPIGTNDLRFLYKTYIAYQLPEPPITQVQITLVENLIHLIRKMNNKTEFEGMFWITDRDRFHDNIFLFDGFRKGLNENRTLETAPCHIFNNADLNDLECLLELTFYFGFYALLILPDIGTVIYINEEWFIDVSCKNQNDYNLFRQLFSGLKLKEIIKK